MKTKIYIANADCLENGALFEKNYVAVKEARQKKIDKIRFESDKRLSLGAELLIKNALDDYGFDYNKTEFVYGKNGKPYLKDGELFFNLSHSGSIVCCAVSDSEIGIDVEQIERANLKISKRIFNESELKHLESKENREKEFIRLWTLKESYMKFCGSGLSIDPIEIEIEFFDNLPRYKNLSFFEYETEGCLLSCCGEKIDREIEIIRIDFK